MRSDQIDEILDNLGRWIAEIDEAYDAVTDTPTRHERLVMIASLNGALTVNRAARECHAGALDLPYDAVLACLGNGWLIPDDGDGYEVTRRGKTALHSTPSPEPMPLAA